MRFFWFILWLFPFAAWGQVDHKDPGVNPPASGMSVYQLNSHWTDAYGRDIYLKDLEGGPRLIVMLYTRCQSACPLIIEDMKGIVASLPEAQRSKLSISLFSIDSENETTETLRQFAETRKLGTNWRLFRSGKSEVSTLAAALGFRYKRLGNNEYVHSNVIYLLNGRGEIIAHKEGFETSRADFAKMILSRL